MYRNLGAIKREQFLNNKTTDPIYAFCPFQSQGVTFGGTLQRAQRGDSTRKRHAKKPTAPP